jgi:hypothetical protein
MSEIVWSEWLDFSSEQISKIPAESGVYTMHAAMKILVIGGTQNLRETILETLNDSCTKDAKRFKYSILANYEEVRMQLIKEYQEKHSGQLPKCMQ